MKRVLVVSHADADGHVIAEQVRRNLSAVSTFVVSTVIDPVRTKDHKTWTQLDTFPEIDTADIVVFVDLMFAPISFGAEADALVDFVSKRPTKQFFVLDHHPLPLRRLNRAPNLRSAYRPDVVDCTVGDASGLMVLAALLESQPSRVKETRRPEAEVLAKGIKRAAALGGPLVGAKLLALIHFECWGELVELGRDDARYHRLPRGRRPMGDPISEVLKSLDGLATNLIGIESAANRSPALRGPHAPRRPMSYDFETAADFLPPTPAIAPSDRRDLEAIVTLLELAAISLTDSPESSFTSEQLIAEAHRIGGSEIALDEKDIRIVLGKAGFLSKRGGRLFLK